MCNTQLMTRGSEAGTIIPRHYSYVTAQRTSINNVNFPCRRTLAEGKTGVSFQVWKKTTLALLLRYGWDVMSGNRSKSAFFEGGWVTLSADFRGKGASPTNHCWRQKTRVIAVSCGIKIFAVRCLVLSQYTHLTDIRTELRQQYRALHYMQSHGKNTNILRKRC